MGIEMVEVYAETDSHPSFEPIPQRYTTCCDWGESQLNPTSVAGGGWWRNLPKLLFKWGIIGDFNYMFSRMSTAKLTGL